jgi:HlyD family secretion protein
VPNGPAFTGKKKQFIYVLKDDKAYRREVETGLSNFDFVEIKSGVGIGEQVILTDLNDYEHLEEISVE